MPCWRAIYSVTLRACQSDRPCGTVAGHLKASPWLGSWPWRPILALLESDLPGHFEGLPSDRPCGPVPGPLEASLWLYPCLGGPSWPCWRVICPVTLRAFQLTGHVGLFLALSRPARGYDPCQGGSSWPCWKAIYPVTWRACQSDQSCGPVPGPLGP